MFICVYMYNNLKKENNNNNKKKNNNNNTIYIYMPAVYDVYGGAGDSLLALYTNITEAVRMQTQTSLTLYTIWLFNIAMENHHF